MRSPRLLAALSLFVPVALAAACSSSDATDASDATADATTTGSTTSTGAGGAGGGGGAGPACAPGTTRDGEACVDVDECATDNGGCGEAGVFRCENREAAPPGCTFDWASDYAAITKGVHTLVGAGAVPSAMVVHGDTAFPVALDGDDRTFVAAARVEKGRAVVFAHETYLASYDAGDDRAPLAVNAARWAGKKDAPVVAVAPGLGDLQKTLEAAGLAVKPLDLAALGGVDVLATSTYDDRPEAEFEAIRAFVRAGGGLLAGGQAWWWVASHADVATKYPGNRLIDGAGIVITAEYTDGGTDAVGAEAPGPLLHAGRALAALAAHVTGQAKLSLPDQLLGVATAGFAVDVLPLSVTAFFAKAEATLAAAPPPVPSEKAPVERKKAPVAAFEIRLQSKLAREQAAILVKAHAAADDFPGAVPAGAKTVSRTITVDASYVGLDSHYAYAGAGEPVWRGTGLYAAPGAQVTVKVPPAAAGKGLSVQIGCHNDALWDLEAWPRFPRLDRTDAIDAETTATASAFGGPVYVRVPAGAAIGAVEVTIEGAIEAPRFVAGKTTQAEWKTRRDAPGPWAELESGTMIWSLPSSAIRTQDDPSAMLALWDQVLDSEADLAAIPHARPRPERFVVDREISAGYLHSGYPVMAHLDQAPLVLDVGGLHATGAWGELHELGHNHQWIDWVLPGATEASVNLFSVYVSENLLGLPREEAHPALAAAERKKRIADYLATGPDFSQWSVWTALETYLQLQEAFGWAPYQALFAEYRAIPANQAPQTDAERIDQWVVRSSKAVGKDLGPFYSAWGFPVSKAALAETAALPAWAGDPMAK